MCLSVKHECTFPQNAACTSLNFVFLNSLYKTSAVIQTGGWNWSVTALCFLGTCNFSKTWIVVGEVDLRPFHSHYAWKQGEGRCQWVIFIPQEGNSCQVSLSLSLSFFNLHEEWIKWRSTVRGNDYDFANVDGKGRYQRMVCF